MKNACIYKITNIKNNQCYIGQTFNFKRRVNEHKLKLNSNNHCNKKLQNSWNKYGSDAFDFSILESLETIKEKLTEREQYWMDTVKPEFNICPASESVLGLKWSEESKLKISIARTGLDMPSEIRNKISNSMKGKNIGKKTSKETLLKLSNSHNGIKPNKETRIKLSNSKKGSKNNLAKLTEEQVREIKFKHLPEGVLTQKEIANLYKVCRTTIQKIVYGKNWSHII